LSQISFRAAGSIFQRLISYLYVLLLGPENRQLTILEENRVLTVPATH
jgi:hypothetical protein